MNLKHAETTIAAIATPPGPGGIGVVRISGREAFPILTRLFKPRHTPAEKFTSHKMYYGWIVHPVSQEVIDEVLVVYMRAPRTYTREDVVEIHTHGSYLILQEILSLILESGAKLAEPGEFTKQAFLAGRIDLTQAEAVLEVLQAKTKEGLRLAMSRLQGRLYNEITVIRNVLLSVRATMEVAIDFPEDDVEILDQQELQKRLTAEGIFPLETLIANSEKGKIFRDGIAVVILGKPNVGKSSLLNSLLQEERAIVTEVPGTTRDTIEESIGIKGIPVRIIDTAGIREAEGAVEEIGIKRSKQKLDDADLVLLVFDASESLSAEDKQLFESIKGKPHLLIVNKIDIAFEGAIHETGKAFPGSPLVAISAKTREGLAQLEISLFELVTGGALKWDPVQTCVPNIRHSASLTKALHSIQKVMDGINKGLPPDLLAIDLQSALDYLGDIVGETDVEDMLDIIFSQFCIGK